MRWVTNCDWVHSPRYVRVLTETQKRQYVIGPVQGHTPQDALNLCQWGIVGIYAMEAAE